MTQSKIIKLNVKKRRRPTKDVGDVFERARKKAEQQGWNKVVIIGQGKTDGGWQYSDMLMTTALGMIEICKHHLMADPEE